MRKSHRRPFGIWEFVIDSSFGPAFANATAGKFRVSGFPGYTPHPRPLVACPCGDLSLKGRGEKTLPP